MKLNEQEVKRYKLKCGDFIIDIKKDNDKLKWYFDVIDVKKKEQE